MHHGEELSISKTIEDYNIPNNAYIVFTRAKNYIKVFSPEAESAITSPIDTRLDVRGNLGKFVGEPVFTFVNEGHLMACNGNAIFEKNSHLNSNKSLVNIVGQYHNLMGPVVELCVTNKDPCSL
jgi:hypothetical protein